MNYRLEYILELIKIIPETKYILTNQFLAGDLVHSYVDGDNISVTFSFTSIPETKKIYGVYSHAIEKVIIIFDSSYKYPSHREYEFLGDNFKLFFKTNVDIIDNLDKNRIRSERLKNILEDE